MSFVFFSKGLVRKTSNFACRWVLKEYSILRFVVFSKEKIIRSLKFKCYNCLSFKSTVYAIYILFHIQPRLWMSSFIFVTYGNNTVNINNYCTLYSVQCICTTLQGLLTENCTALVMRLQNKLFITPRSKWQCHKIFYRLLFHPANLTVGKFN